MIVWKIRGTTIPSLTTEMFSFSSSFFLLFLVFFVRGVRLGEASLPATPSIFFFFVLVPPFALCELTVVALVVIVSSRLSLCINTAKQIFIRRLKTQSDALLNWSRIHTRSVVIFKMFFFRNFILYRWYTYLRYIWSLDRRWCVTKVKNKNFGIVN